MKYTGGVRITLTSTARPEFRAVHHRRRGRPLRWHCAAPVRPPLRRVVAPAGRPRVPGPAHADAHLCAVARWAVAALRQRRGPLPARQHRGPPGCAPRSAAAAATRRHVTTHALPPRATARPHFSCRASAPGRPCPRATGRAGTAGGRTAAAAGRARRQLRVRARAARGLGLHRRRERHRPLHRLRRTRRARGRARGRWRLRKFARQKLIPSDASASAAEGRSSNGPPCSRVALLALTCLQFAGYVCRRRVHPSRIPRPPRCVFAELGHTFICCRARYRCSGTILVSYIIIRPPQIRSYM
jgi:hypothetical protein